MRERIVAAACVICVAAAGCGDEPTSSSTEQEGVDLAVMPVWTDDSIRVTVEADLPDGALVNAWAVDHDELGTDPPLDAADAEARDMEFVDGEASATLDVSAFEGDAAVVEVSFLPRYEEQPSVVEEQYEPNEGDDVTALVERGSG